MDKKYNIVSHSPHREIAQGSVASFTTDVPAKAHDVTIDINPSQDLHGYENPWPAGGGKNLFNKDALTANTWIAMDGTTTEPANGYSTSDYIPITQGEIYYAPAKGSSRCAFYDTNKNGISYYAWIGGSAFTAGQSGYMRITLLDSSVDYNTYQFEKSSSATSWSPYSNICPITGWDGATVTDDGKNLLAMTLKPTASPVNGLTLADNNDGSFTLNGTVTGATGNFSVGTGSIFTIPAGSYILSGGVSNTYTLVIQDYDNGNLVVLRSTGGDSNTYTFVQPTRIYCRIRVIYAADMPKADNLVFRPMLRLAVETDATFAPYIPPRTASVDFGQTIYGGTVDLVTGECTVDRGYIASYAGETLPGEWISSMDVYTPGGIPTTGAQVVYKLANPIPLTLTPAELELFKGTNNISADTGDTAVEYWTH